MVPKLRGELFAPPPPEAELRPADPWEVCSTASTKEASIAAAVRQRGGGGGYCQPTSSWAAVRLAVSGAIVSTSTNWTLASRATRRPVETADLSCCCLILGMPCLHAGQNVTSAGGIAPPSPPPPSGPLGPWQPPQPPMSMPVALPVPPLPSAPSPSRAPGFSPWRRGGPFPR